MKKSFSTRRPALAITCLVAGFFVCSPLAAQEIKTAAEAESVTVPVEERAVEIIQKNPYENYLSFSYENDLVGDGSDRYYTSGVRLTYYNMNTVVPDAIDDIALLIPGFDINGTTATFFTLGQNLYTPSSINERVADANDRPYAAWLYGSVGLSTVTQNHVDDIEVTLGVVGPEALGEQTQKFIHTHITGSQTPKGWSNQLDFEPGIILSWQRRWPQGFNGDWHIDFGHKLRLNFEPNVNVSLGNIYTYAGTGMMLTFGPYQDTLQDTPPRVKPAISGSGYFAVPDQDWSWHLFAGIDGRAVARNIFLDGNSFKSNSPAVDKKYFVGDAVAGLSFTLNNYRLSYTANYRTREFDNQPEDTVFGSITLTTRF